MTRKSRDMLTTLLLIGAVVVQCLSAPSSSDLETAETKWKGHHYSHGLGGGPGLYNRGLGFGGGGLYGRWGGGWPGVSRFDGDYYGPYGNGGWPGVSRFDGGYYGPYDESLAAFSLGAFRGGVDPWGLGYSGFGPWY